MKCTDIPLTINAKNEFFSPTSIKIYFQRSASNFVTKYYQTEELVGLDKD